MDTLLYRAVLFGVSLLPRSQAFPAARAIGRLKYRKSRSTLVRQTSNVQRCLHIDHGEAERVLQRSFELEACEFLEGALCRFRKREQLLELIEIRGLQHLAEALQRGKGAILCSGHVRGNFSFFAALGLLGYKPNPVRLQLRSMQHPVRRWFGDRFDRLLQEKFDCRFLWSQPDSFGIAVQVANALKRNEVVIILVDLSFSAENVEVEFLSDRARFPSGPALLAQATGAPILNYFVHRNHGTPQIAEIGPALSVAEDAADVMQHCASRLEEKIRRHPADWGPWLIRDWELFATWGRHTPWTHLESATNRF